MSNISIYFMFLATNPVSMAKRSEAIQGRFSWGDSDEKMRYHLVAWGMVKYLHKKKVVW